LIKGKYLIIIKAPAGTNAIVETRAVDPPKAPQSAGFAIFSGFAINPPTHKPPTMRKEEVAQGFFESLFLKGFLNSLVS
jgi:hypothetical protein